MSYISKPVDWEVYNVPPVQPVQYYSMLKKKREFFQRQYDTQVFKRGYLHYCGVVPINVSSSLNSRYEIIIVFFDEMPTTSFIGFRVKVSKESFIHESNSLLLFLKKSKKAIFYLMNNNYIHVECGTNAWELFYCLYDDYLRRYVLTFIGTQFFYYFVYSRCIKKELQLLEMLYKGSKVIRVSKNSIYYKIHRKRKISVTDLIHMTLNMPKNKRYVISCFSSKEPLLYSNLKDGDFYTASGSKIDVSKLVFKKLQKHSTKNLADDSGSNSIAFEKMLSSSNSVFCLHSESLETKFKSNKQVAMKRKFEDIENNKSFLEPGPSTSKFYKTSESNSFKEDQWEQYQNLKPYSVKTYSSIPCLSHLVPNLKNGKSSHFANANSYLLDSDCHFSVLPTSSLNEEKAKSNISEFDSESKGTQVVLENMSHNELQKSCNLEAGLDYESQNIYLSNPQSCKTHELSPYTKCSVQDSDTKAFTIPLKITKNRNQDNFGSEKDVGFTTAAGNSIKISNTAMLTAQKLIQEKFNDENQDSVDKRVIFGPKKSCKTNFKSNYFDSSKKLITECKPLTKFLPYKSHSAKFLEVEEGTSSKNVNFGALDDASFSTAAGKKINVSNTALEVAHKLIQNVFSEETVPVSSTNIASPAFKNKIFKNRSDVVRDIDCSSKTSVDEDAIDVDMDKTLVEKFFEDTLFDEKELEPTIEISKNQNTDLISKNDNKIHSSRKPRKSLGGRRSMRYSDKL